MLDKIWSCATQDEFFSWYETLHNRDQIQADTLVRLLSYETMDLDVKSFDTANQLLKQFQL